MKTDDHFSYLFNVLEFEEICQILGAVLTTLTIICNFSGVGSAEDLRKN